MPGKYSNDETKIRPGAYFREENGGGNELSGARNGVVAVAFKANWGPLGQVKTLSSPSEIAGIYGDDSGSNSNVAVLNKIFQGGASAIHAVRVGTGGTKASHTLKDTTSGAAVDVVTLTAKYAGTRALSVTIKDSLAVSTKRECIIYSGTKELMKVMFAKGSDEVNALVAAINENSASIVTATKVAAGNGTLAAVTQVTFGTAGASPAITTTDYDTAFALLEAKQWNALCVDSNDTSVHALVAAFIERANSSGIMAVAVIGQLTSVTLATRKAAAASFNDPKVIYVANGFGIDDVDYEGFNAAAVIAGAEAYLPSSDSMTHKSIPGATRVIGALTNTEVEECLQSGCLVFTVSASGAVWIEQGINTLVTLSADQDAGWKKIRRTKTRFELMQRINENTENVIGNVNCDQNGLQTIIAIGQGVINAMIAEGKLQEGSIYVDEAHPPRGDSMWFIIDVLDLDSAEHVYLTYRFRFSDN